ncbi:MAG TPA: hypothetical protein VMU57_18445 [Edaphobacter sp.]|uniref:hypothetical protein n=1 Tax=Edaphobacter sp. TaxID=1934404 RepID=UPI002C222DCD|nr:hypothetical protein [Edaphobacter sp.]HUZ96889.1 hypothetical protein [Edaphobacter sp.]
MELPHFAARTHTMRPVLLALLFSVLPTSLPAQQPSTVPTAEAIMARVAANQDTSEAERTHFLYVQHAHVTSRKGSTVRCEETTDTRITPTATGSDQQLLKLDGRLLYKHKYLTYTHLPSAKSTGRAGADQDDINIGLDDDKTIDRQIVEAMRNDLTNGKSKDGINAGLFPLTSKTQATYSFKLIGRENRNGRDVFHIAFQPKEKKDFSWKGDAYIDTIAYQPVLVRTTMSRRIPFAARTLLGTSLPGLGFTVIYAPQPAPPAGVVWFPVSFGTEFKMHIFFFFNREIIISAENRNFEQTHVQSKIIPVTPPTTP